MKQEVKFAKLGVYEREKIINKTAKIVTDIAKYHDLKDLESGRTLTKLLMHEYENFYNNIL